MCVRKSQSRTDQNVQISALVDRVEIHFEVCISKTTQSLTIRHEYFSILIE